MLTVRMLLVLCQSFWHEELSLLCFLSGGMESAAVAVSPAPCWMKAAVNSQRF